MESLSIFSILILLCFLFVTRHDQIDDVGRGWGTLLFLNFFPPFNLVGGKYGQKAAQHWGEGHVTTGHSSWALVLLSAPLRETTCIVHRAGA